MLPKGRKNIKAQIIKHYQHLSDREAFVTAEMVRNVFAQFHISPKCKERTFLTEDDGEHQSSELKKVMVHEFEDSNLAFARDLFVFTPHRADGAQEAEGRSPQC